MKENVICTLKKLMRKAFLDTIFSRNRRGGMSKMSADCQQEGAGKKFSILASADIWMPPNRKKMNFLKKKKKHNSELQRKPSNE